MSVDSVALASWGPQWRRFGGVGCGWGCALDLQRGYYGLGMGVGCGCVQGVANMVIVLHRGIGHFKTST